MFLWRQVAGQDPQQHQQQMGSAGYPQTITHEQMAALHQHLTGAGSAPEHMAAAQAQVPAPAGNPGAPDQDAMLGALSAQEQHMANLAAALGQQPDHSRPDQVCFLHPH